MEPHDALPASHAAMHLHGHLLAVLEKRLPGISDELVVSLEDEALQREIIRLRGPREAPDSARARKDALAWATHVRLVLMATLGAKRRKRRA